MRYDDLNRHLEYTHETFSIAVVIPGQTFSEVFTNSVGAQQGEKALATLQRIRAAVMAINDAVRDYNYSNTHPSVEFQCDIDLRFGPLKITRPDCRFSGMDTGIEIQLDA